MTATGERSLPYGGGHLVVPASVPDFAWNWSAPLAAAPLDATAIGACLDEADFGGYLAGAQRVCILIPDATRTARSDLFLPPMFERLRRVAPSATVDLVLATGTHPAPANDDADRLLGSLRGELLPRQHDCRTASFIDVAVSESGNVLQIDRRVYEADRIVLGGRVGNHYFAGFSGGPKALLPGVASLQTILGNHRQTLVDTGHWNPLARNGHLENNPIHREMRLLFAAVADRAFIVNTIVDAAENVSSCHAGPSLEVHRDATERLRSQVAYRPSAPVDVLIASAGGTPHDASMMQALKTPANWHGCVRDGGALIWLAQMSPERLEGFLQWSSHTDDDGLRRAAVDAYALFAHNTVLLRSIARRVSLIIVSSLPGDTVRKLGYVPASSLEHAVSLASNVVGDNGRWAAVHHGNLGYVENEDHG